MPADPLTRLATLATLPPKGARGAYTASLCPLPLGGEGGERSEPGEGVLPSAVLRNRAGPRGRGRQFARAERAVKISGSDGVMAGGAGGVKVEFALGAEIEGRVRHGSATGARDPHRLPHEEVDDEPNSLGDEDHYQRPKRYAHSSSLCVAIHVTDQQHEESEYYAPKQSNENPPGQRGRVRIAREQDRVQEQLQAREEYHGEADGPPGDHFYFLNDVRLCFRHGHSP